MATQGIVSVREDEEVVMKVITGSDGDKAESLADRLKKDWPVDAETAYDIAIETAFGDVSSLVVMTLGKTLFEGDNIEGEYPLYRETFSDPNFNPRWKEGTAEHTEVIDV